MTQPTTPASASAIASTTASTYTGPSRSVSQSVFANEVAEGKGAKVRRSIGTRELRNLTPFLMLDHFKAEPGASFPDHPHRGQTTVTYMIDGHSEHEDSQGNRGMLDPGDVQWMTAGRGILHAEVPWFDPDPAKAVPAMGFQLWVDLPKEQKFIEPSYQEKKAKEIPTVHLDGADIVVISGESHGATGFVRPVGGCWYFDYKLSKPGVKVHQPLPKGWTAFAYVYSGQVEIGDEPFPHNTSNLLVLTPDEDGVTITRPSKYTNGTPNDTDTRFILVAGEPLNQPIVQYGPFVVNSAKQVQEAFDDFREGKNGFESARGWTSTIAKDL